MSELNRAEPVVSRIPGAWRLALWAVLVTAAALTRWSQATAGLIASLRAPLEVVDEQHVAPWAVAGLCALGLASRRRDIVRAMRSDVTVAAQLAGAATIVTAAWLPPALGLPTAAVGLFAILFGRAARVPAILLGLYVLTFAIQPAVEGFAGQPFALAAAIPTADGLAALGFPIVRQGQWVTLQGGGEPLMVIITAACAGPTTLALFIAGFVVMALDRPLPRRTAAVLLALGLFGTWAHNLVRVTLMLLIGTYADGDVMNDAHVFAGYLMFPLWMLLFAYVYLRQWQRHVVPAVVPT